MDGSYDSNVPLEARYKTFSPLTDTKYESVHSADLSVSDLSVASSNASASGSVSRPSGKRQPFSLLARPSQPSPPDEVVTKDHERERPKGRETDDEMVVDAALDEETVHADAGHARTRTRSASGASEGEESRMQSVSRSREDRLRHDLFVMRKLNDAFALYIDSLSSAQSATERVAEQLTQTNSLLDRYVDILVQSETATKMIFDERWHGAEDDEATAERIAAEKAEKARIEAEKCALAEQQEAERREKEEREREAREERERAEAAKKERLAARAGFGGSRGRVRGARRATAAPVRGATRGTVRGSTSNLTTTGSGGRGSVSSRASLTRTRGVR